MKVSEVAFFAGGCQVCGGFAVFFSAVSLVVREKWQGLGRAFALLSLNLLTQVGVVVATEAVATRQRNSHLRKLCAQNVMV